MSVLGSPFLLSGTVLLAFSAGWSVNGWRHDAKVKSATDHARAEEQVKLDQLRISLDDANSARLSLAADLASEKADIKIKYRTIAQEVPTHAPQNTDACNYDLYPGLVGLLNTAARGGIGHPQNAVEPAGQRLSPVSVAATNSTD